MKLDKQVRELSRVLYTDLDTPYSLGCFLLLKYDEWDQLAQRRVDPRHYLDTVSGAERFRRDYQAAELLRKYPGLPGFSSQGRKDAALRGFWEAEKQCFLTNQRLDRHLRNYGLSRPEMRLAEFIDKVKKLVSRVLGPLPDDLEGRFGPGATFESRGHRFAASLTAADKMAGHFYCTSAAVPLLPSLWRSAWGRAVLEDSGIGPEIVEGNRFTTVPKDALKDRGICIEPGANVFLQLGVGRHVRHRLKLFGIDLKHGQMLHRRLARHGSFSNELATIDLSSASDTVAYLLVKLLLPEDWFQLFDSLRCPKTRVGGSWVLLEKFSSMGNGFTFELETLIFACLAAIYCGEKLGDGVWAYGDDLIVPRAHGQGFTECLRYFGFTPNERKTFTDGAFRESCGGDFFNGVEVTPYHLTEVPDDPASWIAVANGLRRFGYNSNTHSRARLRVLGFIPAAIRAVRGPSDLGDLVIHDDDQRKWQVQWRHCIRYIRVWRPVSRRVRLANFTPGVQLAVALYGSAEGDRTTTMQRVVAVAKGLKDPGFQIAFGSYLTPRNGVSGYRMGRVAFS